jgi:hypothetical protein
MSLAYEVLASNPAETNDLLEAVASR